MTHTKRYVLALGIVLAVGAGLMSAAAAAAPSDHATETTTSPAQASGPSESACVTPPRDLPNSVAQFLYDETRQTTGDGCASADIGAQTTTVCYPGNVETSPPQQQCTTVPVGTGTIDPGELDVCVTVEGDKLCALDTSTDTAGQAAVLVFGEYDGTVNPALRSVNETAPGACVEVQGVDVVPPVCSGQATGTAIQTSETAACEGQRLGEELQEDEQPRSC